MATKPQWIVRVQFSGDWSWFDYPHDTKRAAFKTAEMFARDQWDWYITITVIRESTIIRPVMKMWSFKSQHQYLENLPYTGPSLMEE